MTESISYSHPLKQKKTRNWLASISLPWLVTVVYLVLILLLPVSALISKSLTLGAAEFGELRLVQLRYLLTTLLLLLL